MVSTVPFLCSCGSPNLKPLPHDLVTGEGVESVPMTTQRYQCPDCGKILEVENPLYRAWKWPYGRSVLEDIAQHWEGVFHDSQPESSHYRVDPDFDPYAAQREQLERIFGMPDRERLSLAMDGFSLTIKKMIGEIASILDDSTDQQKEAQRQEAKADRAQKRKALMSGGKGKPVPPRNRPKPSQFMERRGKRGKTSKR